MTDRQWRDEVAAALRETDWFSDWSAVSPTVPHCFADATNRLTHESKTIHVSREVFRTPEARKAEILKHLSSSR